MLEITSKTMENTGLNFNLTQGGILIITAYSEEQDCSVTFDILPTTADLSEQTLYNAVVPTLQTTDILRKK
jgi:hypothetical protein